MVDVDDVQQMSRKLEQQLDKLDAADIPGVDQTLITALVRDLDRKDRADSTIANHCNNLRVASERAEMALSEMELDDVEAFLWRLKREYELSEGTRRNYRKSLRLVYRVDDRDWADGIEIGASPERKVDPSDLLTQAEIDALFDACQNARDKALIAVLLDTGLRIGAVLSLRVRDVSLTERAGTISLNHDADGLKDASGTVPITWSRGYVVNWLEMHPRRDEPDVAFMHQLSAFDADDDGALSYQVVNRKLKRIADRTDVVDRGAVNPHAFRKTAISRWIREGASEQEIKHRATWTEDSDQFAVYSGVTDEELNEQILDRYDLTDGDLSARPTMETCPQCGQGLRDGARFCSGCGVSLDQAAAEQINDTEDEIVDTGFTVDGLDEQLLLRAVRRSVRGDVSVREAVVDELDD